MPSSTSNASLAEAQALLARINKDLKEDVLVMASEMKIARTFTTGSISLDVALGGGWPGNQWCEIRGRESNGKTAIVLKTIAANQAEDPNFATLWIAAEHYDVDQATALGVDNDRVVVASTQDMSTAYSTILKFAEARAVDCIVLDSYPALIVSEEDEKGMEDAVVAVGARMTGKFFRKAGSATRRSMTDEEDRPILGLFINQFRDKIGGFSPMGTPQTSPGGNAKNYAFYVQVDVKRDEFIEEKVPGKDLKNKVGQSIKITTVKNKQAPPRQVATVDFYFRDAPILGFKRGDYDTTKELIILALIYDLIERRGAYFQYGEHRWQGREAMYNGIREDVDLTARLDADVRSVVLQKGGRELADDVVAKAETTGTRKVARKKKAEPEEEAVPVLTQWDPDLPHDAPGNVAHAVAQMAGSQK